MPETEKRGMSAAQANRHVKRAKAPSSRAAPRQFTIRRKDAVVLDAGSLADVRALLPGVKSSLLARRLDSGERDYDRLARPPDTPASRKRQMTAPFESRRKV